MNKLTPAGLHLIKHFESGDKLHLKPYRDSAGVLTIGWGHTRTTKRGMKITPQEAEDLLASDLEHAISAVNHALKAAGIAVNDAQFSAMVSAVFNLGPKVVTYADATWWRQFVDLMRSEEDVTPQKIGEAIAPLVRWNKFKKKRRGVNLPGQAKRYTYEVSKGLTRRRFSEIHLFLTGEFDPQFEAVGMKDPGTDKNDLSLGAGDVVKSRKSGVKTSELYVAVFSGLIIAFSDYLQISLSDAQVTALATLAAGYIASRTFAKREA